jgi:hypothetical protein
MIVEGKRLSQDRIGNNAERLQEPLVAAGADPEQVLAFPRRNPTAWQPHPGSLQRP